MQKHRDDEHFGRRTMLWRAVVLVCATTIFLTVSWSAWNLVQVQRAKRAFRVFRSTRVGNAVSPATLTAPWQCSSNNGAACSFAFENWPFPHTEFSARLQSLASRLGAPFWHLQATITLDKNGLVQGRYALLDVSTELAVSLHHGPEELHHCDFDQLRHPQYQVGQARNGHVLLIRLGSTADARLVERGDNLELQCLASIRGCHSYAQLAPAAWEDLKLDSDFAYQNAHAMFEFDRTCK